VAQVEMMLAVEVVVLAVHCSSVAAVEEAMCQASSAVTVGALTACCAKEAEAERALDLEAVVVHLKVLGCR
jgi:hypothetical protein